MEDRELVREIIDKGRTGLYAEVVKRYSGIVYSKALAIVRQNDRAAEVTQSTFVKAYEQLRFWRGQQMAPWLVSIAMHTALHLMDKERVRRAQPIDDIADDIPDLSIQTYYEQMWRQRGIPIKYLRFRLPHEGQLIEPDVEIPLDEYRSYNRSKRSASETGK